MVNIIWFLMVTVGIGFAAVTGRIEELTGSIFSSAELAVELILGLVGVMGFWLGIAKLIQRSGLMRLITLALSPVVRFLFPSVPVTHPATGAILMNLTANLLGLGNAATPFGIKAMRHLQQLNSNPKEATHAMCTFLALNTACITLIPTMVIAVRTSLGSVAPTEILGTTLVATLTATGVALVVDRLFQGLSRRER